MKKSLVILLSLVFVISMSLSAFAAHQIILITETGRAMVIMVTEMRRH